MAASNTRKYWKKFADVIVSQVFPKRCGQLTGKDVVNIDEYLERIRSAVEARRDPDFVIIARTDARQATIFGGATAGRHAFDEGVKRLKAALEAGADMAFMESPRTEEECQTLVKELAGKPVLINVLPHVSIKLPSFTCPYIIG